MKYEIIQEMVINQIAESLESQGFRFEIERPAELFNEDSIRSIVTEVFENYVTIKVNWDGETYLANNQDPTENRVSLSFELNTNTPKDIEELFLKFMNKAGGLRIS